MNITIIGTGYVGLTTGVALAYFGHKVTCIDKNQAIVDKLSKGQATIHEQGLEELLKLAMPNLSFQTNLAKLSGEGIVLIAVGTPAKESGEADLQFVDSAAAEIADLIEEGAKLVVINKSTVPIGTARHVEGIIHRNLVSRNISATVWVASNPEFLAEGRAVKDTLYPDRIVVGTDNEEAAEMLRDMYKPLLEQSFDAPLETPRPEDYTVPPFITSSTTSAELTKLAANAFLATKISFINEFSRLAEHVGADITEVSKAIGLDSRIGSKHLQAGIGWGGSCFGKDTQAIIAASNRYDYKMQLVEATIEVNKRQRLHVIERLQQQLKVLRGTTIGLLGLAFKGDTDDLRDAPSLTLIKELSERDAVVRVHDPIAMPRTQELYPDLPVEYCEDELCLAIGCDAIVLVTDWKSYHQLPLARMKERMRGNLFLDARNMLEPSEIEAHGFYYLGVGR